MESRVYLYMGEWSKSYEASERVLAGKSTLVNLNDEGGNLPNEFTSVEMITAFEVLCRITLTLPFIFTRI